MTEICEKDIDILVNQYNVEREKAKSLLILNEGDIVESIFMVETENCDINKIKNQKQMYKEEETDNFEVDLSEQKNIKKYRDIVDKRDIIYNNKKETKKKSENQKKNLSIEDLYSLKKKKNFNSIKIL